MQQRKKVIAKVVIFGILALICFGLGVSFFLYPIVPQATTGGRVGNTICGAFAIGIGSIYTAWAIEEFNKS